MGVLSLGMAVGTLPAEAQLLGGLQTKTPKVATTIVGRMGVEMPESSARHGIAFRPFAPPRRIVTVALLPPFHGADSRATRGIGFEYIDPRNDRYALAEWPANGGTIEGFPLLVPGETSCSEARTFSRSRKPNGIVWSTSRGVVMTLQPDGANDARTLETEWKKLIRRGACG